MTDETEIRDREQKSRAGCVGIALIAIPVLYALSPPFVAMILESLPSSVQPAFFRATQVIYYPINWLYFHSDFVKSFYDWYQGLFETV